LNTIDQSTELSQLNDAEKRALLTRILEKSNRQAQLSVTQERIWQLNQVAPGNPVYNFQSAIALTGPLNHDALSKSVAKIVTRHETLRTSYGIAQGTPELTVVPKLSVMIDKTNLPGRNPEEQANALQAVAKNDAQIGFSIEKPPLFRLRCCIYHKNQHVLVLTMHHIVSDLISLDLFFEELGAYYGEILSGNSSSVSPLAWTYQDHAHYEHSRRDALKQSPAAQFWQEHLAGANNFSWRSDFPRPYVPTGQAATEHFILDASTVKNVEALARSEAVTPFVVLLSAYYILQWSASDSDDQLVAVPTAGRERDESQGLIGMFSSPLPMRVQLSEQHSVRDLLIEVRRTVLGTSENAAVPFADIIEHARVANNGKLITLRSMFSFISKMKKIVFPGLQLERVPTDRGVSDFDLFLTIYEDAGLWRGVFEYSTDLFGTGTAQNWADAYCAIVRNILTDPMKPVAELAALVPLPSTVQVAVAATFTADLLEEASNYWQYELHCPVHMVFYPYNQVFQALMDQGSDLHSADNTMNVLLVRPEDWIRYSENSTDRHDTLEKATGDFIKAVFRAKLRAPIVIYLCPGSPDPADRDAIAAAEDRIEAAFADHQGGITILRADTALERYGLNEVFDAKSDEIGHIPFSRPWFVALGTEIIRRATSLERPPFKVVALDCDNTLWQGVCGEQGAQGVRVEGPFRALQEFVTTQANDGMLLCLVSKNEEEDVFRVFDENDGMLLKRDRIIAHRINWHSKSENLRELAAELQLGLDSFIFIDDNPVECAEVQAACPEVLTLCLPQDVALIPSFLQNVWAFDRQHVSEEDRKRAESMLQNRHREVFRKQTSSFSDFLAKLELQVRITPVDDESLPRLAQLSQRTNQFNNAGVRYDETGLRNALAGGLQALKATVQDRFGQYGIVGVLFFHVDESILGIDSFLLSCRVLGRGVEHRMLAKLGRIAKEKGLTDISIVYKEMPRNQPFRRFLDSLDGAYSDDGKKYFLTARVAQDTTFEPERAHDDSKEVPIQLTTTTAPGVQITRQIAIASIAGWMRSVDDVMERLDKRSHSYHGSADSTPPQGETELSIAKVWEKVLHIDLPGRNDNFFEVGGNSLLLVQVNSQLIEAFCQDIQITTLFQYPTIASLAKHLSNSGNSAENRAQAVGRGQKSRMQLMHRMKRLSEMGYRNRNSLNEHVQA
jgi:FkbH-like protein